MGRSSSERIDAKKLFNIMFPYSPKSSDNQLSEGRVPWEDRRVLAFIEEQVSFQKYSRRE
jgi:hypothetical protein